MTSDRVIDVPRLAHSIRVDALHRFNERRSSDARVEVGGRPVWEERVAAAVPLAKVPVGHGCPPAHRERVLKHLRNVVLARGQSVAGHELSRRSQGVGQCIFLESLQMEEVATMDDDIAAVACEDPFSSFGFCNPT